MKDEIKAWWKGLTWQWQAVIGFIVIALVGSLIGSLL